MSEYRQLSHEEATTSDHLWALVLAGGEGRRVRHLTSDGSGRSVPKQYASLNGGASLLRGALHRAERIVPRERVVIVVARHHRPLWRRDLHDRPRESILVQPLNRGTGVGLLLGLLIILHRDPRCRLLVFPADHHVDDEAALQQCLESAVKQTGQQDTRPTLLGVAPERTEAGLGWIVPGPPLGPHAQRVVRFVEKPPLPVARRLASRGALVNSMILAGDGAALLGLLGQAVPETVASLRRLVGTGKGSPEELASLYDTLPVCDLSRDVLEQQADHLAVVPTRPCGWIDVGTPLRLARLLDRKPGPAGKFPVAANNAPEAPGRI